jgi:hypothetical protein
MPGFWQQLGPAGQAALCTIIANALVGPLLWLWQRAWTCSKHAGPQPDWTARQKQLFALLLSTLPGLATWAVTGQLPDGLLGVAVVWVCSQATHSLVPQTECKTGDCEANL